MIPLIHSLRCIDFVVLIQWMYEESLVGNRVDASSCGAQSIQLTIFVMAEIDKLYLDLKTPLYTIVR
jgi:hypothetical protein